MCEIHFKVALQFVIVFMVLSYFTGQIKGQTGAGDALQKQLNSLQYQIGNLTLLFNTTVAGLNDEIDEVNAKADEAKATADAAAIVIEGTIVPTLASLTASNKKLIAINQTWKKNFHILNTTLQELRKKVVMKAPYPG